MHETQSFHVEFETLKPVTHVNKWIQIADEHVLLVVVHLSTSLAAKRFWPHRAA